MHVLIAALHRPIKPTGVCRHAVNLARCFAETKEVTRISLVVGSWQEQYFQTSFSLASEKIKLITVNIKNSSVARNRWFLWGLPQLVNDLNPDIIHFSFPFPFLRAKLKTPVVTTIHDLYPYEYPENFGFPQVWFNRLFLKQCISNSDGLVCVSKVTLDKLKFYFPNLDLYKKIDAIYNYVDFEHLKPRVYKQLPEKASFILSVAQHRSNKNLALLIQAYFKLRLSSQIKDNTKLIIVGANGPETNKIHNLIDSLNLKELVLLLSSLDDSSLSWLYQNCELFVIPSSTEGFCLPLAEAIYFSCKVVCSDIPIFREIGATNCTYFQLRENSIHNLKKAIIHTIKQPSYSKALDNYRFRKEKIAVQYLQLYSKII